MLDAGPNTVSSFHVVGTIFDMVRKEGVALLPENDGNWGSQAVDLAPAQGAIIEFTSPKTGNFSVSSPTPSTSSDAARSACSRR